jgi:ribonuclease HII
MQKFLVGVDEAGRGPLAGPVSVGMVMAPVDFDIKLAFEGVADSKKLTPEKREEIYEKLLERTKAGDLQFVVRFTSHLYIDKYGIVKAVKRAIGSGVEFLAPDPAHTRFVLDGLLHAPPAFEQETIIRGDATEPIISLASIAAKVERDRLMLALAQKFPDYGFDKHKGYGTKSHYAAIAQFGLCDIHRRTYCRSASQPVDSRVKMKV